MRTSMQRSFLPQLSGNGPLPLPLLVSAAVLSACLQRLPACLQRSICCCHHPSHPLVDVWLSLLHLVQMLALHRTVSVRPRYTETMQAG